MNNSTISVSPALVIYQLQQEIKEERALRLKAEEEIGQLKQQLDNKNKKAKSKKSTEKEEGEWSSLKSNGQKKATKAESLHSYTDFVAIRDYLINSAKNRNRGIRNATIWTLGIALGIRASDLVKLKWEHLYIHNEEDSESKWVFRDKICVLEKKTSKLNKIVLTPIVKQTLDEYKDAIKDVEMSDYLFPRGDTHLSVNQYYKILKPAQDKLKLKFHLSTHTMRHSFANIVLCHGVKSVDMNAIPIIQGLLNHSAQTTTLVYLDKMDELFAYARNSVSDFLLGKKGDDLTPPDTVSLDDVYNKLEKLERELKDD